MRRRRFTRWAKWACTLAAVLCVGAGVVSYFFEFGFYAQYSYSSTLATWGCLHVCVDRRPSAPPFWCGVRCGWGHASYANLLWLPRLVSNPGYNALAWVPFWIPAVCLAIPAAFLWRRRFGPGHCAKCGYDRAGLFDDTKCPECGTTPRIAAT